MTANSKLKKQKMAKKKSVKSFEEKLARLEELTALLEQENLGLDKSIELYEEGVKLSKECLETLQKAELKVVELKDQVNGLKNQN